MQAPPSFKTSNNGKQASMRDMGKTENSVVVLWIWPEFWWTIAMGVKYHHTKFEQGTHCWWLGAGVACGGPKFQHVSKMAKKCPFWGNLVAQHVLQGGHLHWNQPR